MFDRLSRLIMWFGRLIGRKLREFISVIYMNIVRVSGVMKV